MLVPGDSTEFPSCCKAAEVWGGFEDRDRVPLLSQSVRKGQSEEATADDGPVFGRIHGAVQPFLGRACMVVADRRGRSNSATRPAANSYSRPQSWHFNFW